jgi:uncharacterized protein YqeY
MLLFQQIREDMKTAMKSGEKDRLETLRFILSGLNLVQKEKEMKTPGSELDDFETISFLQKEVKKRKDSIDLFRRGGRNDLVEKEEIGISFIQNYLPKELQQEEIEKIIDDVLEKGFNDFSSVMRESVKVIGGRADGKIISEIVKKKLS